MQNHQQHRYLGEPDEDLIESLEPDQLVVAMNSPLPQRSLGRLATFGLYALRVFLVVITAMVIYAFVASVLHPPQ
jgi:hypothetical protein